MSATEGLTTADIPRLLGELRQQKFYGRISFDMRAGEVVLIRTERTQLISGTAESISHQRENRDGTESSRAYR